jgi:ABC-type branched-subunit amino acid transport system permease subunit
VRVAAAHGRTINLPTGNLRAGNAGVAPAAAPRDAGPGRSLLTGLNRIRRHGPAPSGESSWKATVAQLAALTVIAVVFAASGVPAQYITLGVTVFIYAILASAIALLYHDGGLLSVAHGGLWGVGAYAAAVLVTKYNWQLVPVILAAALAAGIVGMSLASISTRVAGSYFIIILFAVSEVIYGVMINWNSVTNGAEGIVLATPASLFGYRISTNMQWYYVTLITLLIVLVLSRVIKGSQLGQHLRAIRDSRPLATSVGISVARVHMASFAITGAMAGISGVYWAYLEKYVVPSQFSATASISFVVVVLLGGSAYLLGPLLGAVVVIFLPSLLHLPPLLANALIGVIFIAVILLFPEGVVGLVAWALRLLVGRTGLSRWLGPPGGKTAASKAAASKAGGARQAISPEREDEPEHEGQPAKEGLREA